jgi:mxaJ protein
VPPSTTPRAVVRTSLAATLAVPLLLATTLAPPVTTVPATATDAPPRTLRVCADPNNLPFSNVRGEGFENALATLVARDLGADVAYTWQPQRRGFVRNTLAAGLCDVMMSVPASFERVLATAPYFRSTYVFVSRKDRALDVRSFDDPALRGLRIGVQVIGDDYANPPPLAALARRGIVTNVVGYSVYGDYAEPNPPARIIDGVARGDVDVAVAWGPLAGYFATREPVALVLTPVTPQIDLPFLPLVFDMSMGVRRGDTALRDVLDGVLERRRSEIAAVLRDFGIPRVDTW